MELLVVQHDPISPPGAIGRRFEDHGYNVTLHEIVGYDNFETPNVVPDLPSFTQFDAILTMGARWSAYDHDTVGNWVVPEIAALREADAAGVPVLGICFGGQLLAAAHGGSVIASPAPELGWVDISTTDEATVPQGPWFQWHGDKWIIPPTATQIAENPSASQAFALRRNLAVQFHPELDRAMLQGWLDNGGAEYATNIGVDLEALLSETQDREAEARTRAQALVDGFIANVARR